MKVVITPIVDEQGYQKALTLIDEILDKNPKEGTDLYHQLDAITTLVEKYERIHYSIPDPIEYLKFKVLPPSGGPGLRPEFRVLHP